jgi:hypothetical protein
MEEGEFFAIETFGSTGKSRVCGGGGGGGGVEAGVRVTRLTTVLPNSTICPSLGTYSTLVPPCCAHNLLCRQGLCA